MNPFFVAIIAFTVYSAQAASLSPVGTENGFEAWEMSQAIEHGNPSSLRFRQKVYLDRSFARGPSSPVILSVCGESACRAEVLPAVRAAAEQSHAFVLQVEHRYYGSSRPFASHESAESLRYLSVGHALRDLAEVLRSARAEWKLSGPVVAMGCSYAGTLAALLRAEYPELVAGAVADSAPVQAVAAWSGMDRHIGKTLGPACAAKVRASLQAHEDQILSVSGADWENVRHRLGFRKVRHRTAVIEALNDVVRGLTQYGQHEAFCSDMLKDSAAAFPRWVEHSVRQFGLDGGLSLEDIGKDDPENMVRPWYYQICTELGFFQVRDEAEGVASRGTTFTMYQNICRSFFGVSGPDTARFNDTHGAAVRKASKILFLNSAVDPWSDVSVRPDNLPNPGLRALIAPGGGHCSASQNFPPSGPDEYGQAILRAVGEWTGE